MATTSKDADGEELVLEEASSESRCYFVEDGVIKEVALDSGDWNIIGNVF